MELQPILIKCHEKIHKYYETKNHNDIQAIEHNAIARGIRAETVNCKKPKNKKNITKKIDDILINKYFGIPIFLFFMWGLFQLTFELGAIPMESIDAIFSWFGML